MKFLSLLVFLIVISLHFPVFGQEQFPSWVNLEAVQAAKDGWLRRIQIKSDERLSISYGIRREDLSRSQLRDPRKIVNIDYESYEPGSDILAMFSDTIGRYRNGFCFSVYIDNRRVGTVTVAMRHQTWITIGISGAGNSTTDVFSKIYSQYPPADDLIIYQNDRETFFISKVNRIIDAFYWDLATRDLIEMLPEQYMMREKARIIEFKKSDYYKRYLEIMKEQIDSSLELSIPLSTPLEVGEIGYDVGYEIRDVCGEQAWKDSLCWAACAAGQREPQNVGSSPGYEKKYSIPV